MKKPNAQIELVNKQPSIEETKVIEERSHHTDQDMNNLESLSEVSWKMDEGQLK